MNTTGFINTPFHIGQIDTLTQMIRNLVDERNPHDLEKIKGLANDIDEITELIFTNYGKIDLKLSIAHKFLTSLKDDFRTSEYCVKRIQKILNEIENYGNETK